MDDLKARLLAKRVDEQKARPTISELEALLAEPSPGAVVIHPDGSVSGGYINPDGPEAAARIEVLEKALGEVRQREQAVYDDGHMAPGIRNYSRRSAEIIDTALQGVSDHG